MSYSLIIDTTSRYLVIGLGKDNDVIDEIVYECWQRQSEFACLEIKNILDRNNLKTSDIEEIIVSKGPGSYTGVRIGLTIAKVWTITSKVKIKAISSLSAMAGLKKAIVLLDARSSRFYFGMYDNGKSIIDDQVKTFDEVKEIINSNKDYEVVGDGSLINIDCKKIDYCKNMLELSKITDEVIDPDKLIPVYLKEAY